MRSAWRPAGLKSAWRIGPSASEGFDLVFSNPPYIPTGDIESPAPEVPRMSPEPPWMAASDGLAAYRALGTLLPAILKPGGHALLEIGFGQAQAMEPCSRVLN